MTAWMTRLLSGGLALAVCTFAVLPASSEAIPCETPLVVVDTEDFGLRDRICDRVDSILPVLRECHLELSAPVQITFSDSLQSPEGPCFGLFHKGRQWIELLEVDAFERAREDTGVWATIPSTEHYDSIVVHELVHALAEQTFFVEQSCSADEEYIAYAMQLESLSASARSALLNDLGVSSPISPEELNPLILGFSPLRFAAKAWLHFAQPGNGCDFVGKLVRGEATLYLYPE